MEDVSETLPPVGSYKGVIKSLDAPEQSKIGNLWFVRVRLKYHDDSIDADRSIASYLAATLPTASFIYKSRALFLEQYVNFIIGHVKHDNVVYASVQSLEILP